MAATWTTATVVLLLVLASVSTAQDTSPPAPPPEPASSVPGGSCFSALMIDMSDCMTFVEEGSNLTAPAKSCCPELAGVVDRNVTCLCELLSRAYSFRVQVDYNRLMQLPSACDIITPPAALCSDVGVPVAVLPGADSNPTDVPAAASPAGIRASTLFSKNGSRWMGGVGAPAVLLGLITALLLLTLF